MTAPPPSPEATDLLLSADQLQQRLEEIRDQVLDGATVTAAAVEVLQIAELAIQRLRQASDAKAFLDVGRGELTVPLASSIALRPAFLPPAPWHPSPVPVLVVTLGHPTEQPQRPGGTPPPRWTHFVLQVLPDLEQPDVVYRFRAAVERARRLSPS